MFNSSIIARRLFRSRLVVAQSQRMMSTSLLVPLPQKEELPYEVRTTDLSDAEVEKFQI